jgi:hypothetical protein
MANRWKGNFVVAAATTSSGTDYTGKANGAWGLNSQLQQKQASLWARAVGVPAAPIIGTATAGSSQASVAFTAPSDNGGYAITGYTALSSPFGITGTGTSSPITVTGLTNGTAYTFTVKATNIMGTSASSSASNSVTPVGTAVAVSSATSPYIFAYSWSSSGFGVKYSDPSTLPVAASFCSFSQDSKYLAVTSSATPYSLVYPWANGFGTKYSNPSTLLQAEPSTIRFNSLSNVIISATSGASASIPCLSAYSWSASGFGSKFANVSGLLNIGSRGVYFSSTNSSIALAQDSTPYISAYAWSSGFGSKYANPSTLPTALGRQVEFNSTSDTVFEVTNSAGVHAYPWTNASGFGTKYANPSTPVVGNALGLSVTPSGSAVAVGHTGGTFISVYAWSSGFGSKYANPSTLPIAGCQGVSFSRTGDTLALTCGDTPYVMAYAWSSGFGAIYSDPTILPSANVAYSVSFTS